MAIVNETDFLTTLKNVVLALNALLTEMKKLEGTGTVTLPSAAMSGGAGAPSGQYLTITAPDGLPYKIQLLQVS